MSTIGSHDYTLESDAYTDGPAAMDVGDTDGNIYYRILLYNFGDEISLQDTMWATQNGGNISVDSIQVYDPITGNLLETLEIWGVDGHFGKENDYYGIYNLKNLAAYRGCIIGLYYHVDVSAQVAEGETQTITNTVKWTDVTEDSVETTVTNSKPTLEKDSSLDEENNRVYYYVSINPGAKDLHPESDRLQLEDTLTLPNGVSATLLPNTIKLYTYDSANGSNHYLGDDITDTTPVFAVVETEGKENSYTFTVPDETACVVVYAYEIDRGTYAGDNIEVSNAAMLMGSAVISAGDKIQLDNQGSSSEANKATLTIYKIGGNDVSNLLQGVQFDLHRYELQDNGEYTWVRTSLTAQGEEAEDGGKHYITGGDGVEGAIILNFLDEGGGNGNGSHYNTLYRLTEFETLPGYKLDTTPRYYVWGRNGATEESTQAAMAVVLAEAGVTWDEVTFIPYGGSETQTIANEPTTTEITVTKTWQGAEGTPLEEGLPDSVEVTLYQQTDEDESVKYTAEGVTNPVTLTADTNWTYTWEQLPKEVDGQAVTYTVVETPITGWEASYDYGEGATGILEGTVIITNTKQSAFTLPETGGVGPTLVAISGVPLVGAAGVVHWNLRRKRRRGGKGPYPVSLEDLDSSGLRSLAQTLDAYVARDTLTPLLSQKTGEDGMVSFEGLSPGLYLVLGESYTQDNTVYTPSPMLFYLPGQGEDGGWEYKVTASCKFDQEETTDATVFRKVQKVWKDSGNQSKRPEMVFVQLLENGAVVDTVALSEENNWEYTWEGLDASSRWQVAETNVPDGYTVTVTQEGTLFVVTNTYPGKTPSKLPQTGLLWWPVPLLACAGLALVIAGAAARRRGRGSHEK